MFLRLTNVYGYHCAKLHSNHSNHSLFFLAKCSCGNDVNADREKACLNNKCQCKENFERLDKFVNCVPKCQTGYRLNDAGSRCEGKK